MTQSLSADTIPKSFAPMLGKWRQRNINDFGAARHSGDDRHETAEAQIDYLRSARFAQVERLGNVACGLY